MQAASPEDTRLPSLDGLRGLAILGVFWAHHGEGFVHLETQRGLEPSWWLALPQHLSLGYFGVMLFFCISGFVICRSHRHGFRHFWINRFFRLYPLFWLSLAVALLIGHSRLVLADAPVSGFLGNCTMLPGLFGAPYLNAVHWTLQVELIFYLLVSLFFAAGWLENPVRLLGAIGGCVAVRFAYQYFLPDLSALPFSTQHLIKSPPENLALMFWGALMRLAYDASQRRSDDRIRLRRLALAGFALISLRSVVALIDHWHRDQLHNLGGAVIAFLPATLVFVVALYAGLFSNRIIVHIGRISYSMYLFHWLVLVGLQFAVTQSWFPGGTTLPTPAYLGLNLGLSLLLAHLLYHGVEKPSIAWGRRLSGTHRQPAPA